MIKEKQISLPDFQKLSKLVPWITKDGDFDYSKYPLEQPAKDALSTDDSKFRNACYLIITMAKEKRADALIFLYGMFEYYKNDIKRLEILAERLVTIDDIKFVNFLFNQIKETKSSATTRIYISELINKLSYYSSELIIPGFEELLNDKRFSFRMKDKFKKVLYRFKEHSYYDEL